MTRSAREQLFDEALRNHAGLVARIARTYEADAMRCEELRQDIALALWRALPGFRGEASLVTFVARIAHNRGVDHMLARQRDPGGAALAEEYPDPLPEPVQRVEAGERRARLVAAIHELPLGMRLVSSQLALPSEDVGSRRGRHIASTSASPSCSENLTVRTK